MHGTLILTGHSSISISATRGMDVKIEMAVDMVAQAPDELQMPVDLGAQFVARRRVRIEPALKK